ncbi:MMPL family transporter [Nocardiopsis oceani]
MLERWGRFVHRFRWPVLVLTLLATVGASIWGPGVFGAVDNAGGFNVPGSESDEAAEIIEEEIDDIRADVVVLYESDDLTVDETEYREAVDRVLDGLPSGLVESSETYWSLTEQALVEFEQVPGFEEEGAPGSEEDAAPGEEPDPFQGLVNDERTSTYAVLQIVGEDTQTRVNNFEEVADELREADGLSASVGGQTATEATISHQTEADVTTAEMISLPLLMLLLLFVFGTFTSALLPMAAAGMSTVGSFAVLLGLTYITDISIFAITIATILALVLAVDYGLILVSRYREELRRGRRDADAVAATMATAGSTVLVSGVIVAVSLSGLLLFPQMFLRSMGFGGIATVVVAMLSALTTLPALLAILGTRVNSLKIRKMSAAPRGNGTEGIWGTIAHSVMRRPVVYLVACLGAMLALSVPILRLEPGGVDERVLPEGTEVREVAAALEADFPPNATSPIDVVVVGGTSEGDLADYVDRIADVSGIDEAGVVGAEGDFHQLRLDYELDWQSSEARDLVAEVRSVEVPDGTDVLVGGSSADLVDQFEAMLETLPWAALLVGVTVFIMLFLSFGSIVMPLKAMLMNLLSVSVAFGALVWIFQEGNLAGTLGFTPTGTLDPSSLVLIFAILFGLSMDYEVFMLSRVREQYDLTGDNKRSVAMGLQKTGGLVTAAALLLLVVVGSFSFSGITFIQMIGIGMIIAITVDVVVIRTLLVPATMQVMGNANWWAPGPLARLYRSYGIREHDGEVKESGPEQELVRT